MRLRKWIQVYICVTSSTIGISPLRTSSSNERKPTHDEISRWYLIYKRVVNRTSVQGRHVPTPRSSYVLWFPTIKVYNGVQAYRDQKGTLICHNTHSYREANSSPARLEIPHILWTSNVHHRVQKNPASCHPEQINPVHVLIPVFVQVLQMATSLCSIPNPWK